MGGPQAAVIAGDIVAWPPLARQPEVSSYDPKKPYRTIKAGDW
jgi:hypothetical protein